MLLSRTLSKARIAREERPGWLAAWGPVGFDFIAFALVVTVAGSAIHAAIGPVSVHLVVLAAIFFVFIPMQAILIISAMWAARSRWTETGNE